METSTIEAGERLSTLSAASVQRQLSMLPGVHHADVNCVAGSAHGVSGTSSPGHQAVMLHDMGHALGMSMQGMADDLRNRFLVALVFAVPVILYSPMGEMAGNLPTPFSMARKRFLFFAATAAIAYPVWPFVLSAVRAARNKVANRAMLIVLSVGPGYLFSVGATFFYQSEVFFGASAVLLVFILPAHWLEMRARPGASDAIRALMDLAPSMVIDVRVGSETQMSTPQVLADETVLIKPGDEIPVDGDVTEGRLRVDESMLTGESILDAGPALAGRADADHHRVRDRLPRRPRPGHADGHHGRYRPGDNERHPVQKRCGAGERPRDDRQRLRQDQHAHRRPARWGRDGHDNRRQRGTLLAVAAAVETFSEQPLAPEIAAQSMSGSSAVVAIKALVLKRTQLAGITRAGSPGASAPATGVAAGAST